jgi:hypothetical protein
MAVALAAPRQRDAVRSGSPKTVAAGNDMASPRWSQLREASFIAFVCLTMLGLQGWNVWRARAIQVREIRGSLANTAGILLARYPVDRRWGG